jgi:hypothetical protein
MSDQIPGVDEPADLVLAKHDLTSPTWLKLVKHMEARRLALRVKNDGNLDLVATAHVRGHIKALTNLLALGQPDPVVVADEEQPE